MPNVGGARQNRRLLLASIASSALLYSTAIWFDRMKMRHFEKISLLCINFVLCCNSAVSSEWQLRFALCLRRYGICYHQHFGGRTAKDIKSALVNTDVKECHFSSGDELKPWTMAYKFEQLTHG